MKKESAWSKLSPEAKKNQQEYRNKHYSVVGTSLPRERADSFRAYCAAQGKTVSAVLSDYIYSIIGREAQTEKDGSENQRAETKKETGEDAAPETTKKPQGEPQPPENDTPDPVYDTPDSV